MDPPQEIPLSIFDPKGPEPFPECHIERKVWGASPPRVEVTDKMELPVTHVYLSHTDTELCDTKETCVEAVKQIQQKHLDEGLNDIRYNYLVGGDGNVYEGRGWKVKPEVPQLYPEISDSMVDIGYIGYKGTRPVEKQRFAGKSLVKHSFNWKHISEEATFYSDL
ncbi:peptidoglycan-recognition protein LF-like isoform X2 [Macrosteles quadrilineatus]|uniref:peptidoglycan-recognition protein LF-like isoform X2 n=1 Tax=Macrosteles quadrilineatus TaxID=74068 RepID=UPI0023E32EFF|nr:peptidoglycan-recognition protein LF-like isoform X2 [Macrosteles quadrilineatus]